MGDKGEGGVKILKKCVTSFVDGLKNNDYEVHIWRNEPTKASFALFYLKIEGEIKYSTKTTSCILVFVFWKYVVNILLRINPLLSKNIYF